MMGHRGKVAGDGRDAFSRLARKLLHHRAGALAWVKRRYARKARQRARREVVRASQQ